MNPDDSSRPAPPVGLSPPAEPHSLSERRRRDVATLNRLLWLLGLLVVLLVLRYVVPAIVAEVSYAWTRGQLRARHEAAGAVLAAGELKELSQRFEAVAQRLRPTVVNIDTTQSTRPPRDETSHLFGPPGQYYTQGQGSGVIVDPAGYILTNFHVINGAATITVGLSDGRRLRAEVLGYDTLTDLALLKVEASDLTAIEWGDSDQLEAGALVWAMGSPFGLHRTITFGILSGKNRAGQAGTPYQDFLQTDVAVNPGNSGGPLVDAEGRLIGINTAIVGQAYQGITFAIPSSIARDIYDRLRRDGQVARGWLGVALDAVPEERAAELGLDSPRGALVAAVVDGPSPARQAGISAGDVIVSWAGQPIDNPAALSQAVAQTDIGQQAEVELFRGGRRQSVQVTVGRRPNQLR